MKMTPDEFEKWAMEGSDQPHEVEYPRFIYDADGDYLKAIFSPDEYHARRIDGLATAYISEESGEPIGLKIKGLSKLAETLAGLELLMKMENGKVRLDQIIILMFPKVSDDLPEGADDTQRQLLVKLYSLADSMREEIDPIDLSLSSHSA